MADRVPLTVQADVDPGIRFTGTSGHVKYAGRDYHLMQDFGCGTYITIGKGADARRFRISPEALVQAVHEHLEQLIAPAPSNDAEAAAVDADKLFEPLIKGIEGTD